MSNFTPTRRTSPGWSWPRRSKPTYIPKTWPRQHPSPGKTKSRWQQKSPVRRSLKPSGWWTQTNAENWREPCSPKISSFYAKESRLCKLCAEKPLIRANVQTVCRKCAAAFLHKERTPNLTIWRSKFSAPPGTRTLGPLIKSHSSPHSIGAKAKINNEHTLFYKGLRKYKKAPW